VTPLAPTAVPRLIRHPPFVYFWLARVFTTMAYQMLAVAVGWEVYALTNSAFDLGLVGLVQFVPVVALSLVIGHVSDRYDRGLVLLIAQFISAIAAVALATGSVGQWLSVNAILFIIFLLGSARAFQLPALHAMLPSLVPPGQLARAVAGSTTANQTAIIVGPAIGGLLYLAGPAAVFAASAALFVLAGVLVMLIRVREAPPARSAVTLSSLFAGFTFVWADRALLGVISLDLFAILLGGATALLPVYARDILVTGPWGLGLLRSAPAVGALAASFYLSRYPLERRVGPLLFAVVALFGLATVMFGVSTSLLLSMAALAVLGAADSVSVVIRFSLVQLRTPDPMRGRVSTINSLFIGTSNTLGEFESGLTAAWFGAVPAVLIGGIGTIAVALIWLKLFPELARIDAFLAAPPKAELAPESPRSAPRPAAGSP
jgi:MFS family permease